MHKKQRYLFHNTVVLLVSECVCVHRDVRLNRLQLIASGNFEYNLLLEASCDDHYKFLEIRSFIYL